LPSGLPKTFARLRPFAQWLSGGGGPALMYHKLGPRPLGVRLKGLYVNTRLFRQQLEDLQQAGFGSVFPETLIEADTPGVRRIALTFDDGFENVLRQGLSPLQEHGFRALQFLVPDLLGRTNEWEQREGEVAERLMDAAQVREWLAAGHEIGAHTCTHPRLTQIPRSAAREEIRTSKFKLEDLFGRPIRHFCYPYGDWNPAVRDMVVDAGFLTACTTESGLNRRGGDPFRLRRIMARYASRNWKSIGVALRRLWR